jgi:hypothetical protein
MDTLPIWSAEKEIKINWIRSINECLICFLDPYIVITCSLKYWRTVWFELMLIMYRLNLCLFKLINSESWHFVRNLISRKLFFRAPKCQSNKWCEIDTWFGRDVVYRQLASFEQTVKQVFSNTSQMFLIKIVSHSIIMFVLF